jgi:hypothetical protein
MKVAAIEVGDAGNIGFGSIVTSAIWRYNCSTLANITDGWALIILTRKRIARGSGELISKEH